MKKMKIALAFFPTSLLSFPTHVFCPTGSKIISNLGKIFTAKPFIFEGVKISEAPKFLQFFEI